MTTVGETTFTTREIDRFADLTLDRNPIHMDSRTAQRSFAGARVVHGMHVLLTALSFLVATPRESRRFRRVRCEFRHPIVVDEPVRFEYRQRSDGGSRLSVLVDDLACADLRLDDRPVSEPDHGAPEPIRIDEHLDSIREPLDHGPRDLAAFAGTISNAPAAAVTAIFPDLCAAIGSSNVSALSRLSYIVGMLCPGLYSVFASLDVTLASNNAAKGFSKFAVTAVDERFRLVQIALLAGDLVGTLNAFQRPPAFQQPTFESLSHRVGAQEFAGARALVIGGSRGLGELTAKLLCAGGGAVHLTYARGRSDAHRVTAEIMGTKRGVCTPLELDILAPLSSEVLRLLGYVDLVFYFPTPMIFRKKSKTFNAAILHDFLRFYVEGFSVLYEAAQAVATQPVRIFYPSSIAVDSRPKGMSEYAMAKAAGEVLISDLNASSSKVQIVSSRLPRMGSDQTNTIPVSVGEADSIAIMLSTIRSMWPF
jgi:NADP-dependent 3-hydroxy acid dehydrogenase YdfG